MKISVLGCVVNGPGEAREADLGIAAGKGKGVIFKRGEIVRHVLENEMVDALMEEIDKWEVEEDGQGHAVPREARRDGQWPCAAADAEMNCENRACNASQKRQRRGNGSRRWRFGLVWNKHLPLLLEMPPQW